MNEWTRADLLQIVSIVASALIAIAIYMLQKRLTNQQKLDHRLEVETKIESKFYRIKHTGESLKVNLYNTKLLNKKYFPNNKRDVLWGYPFHAAELYAANFDGLECIVDIEEWNGKKYYRVGLIPYDRVLGIRPDGDGSFNGMIIYVKPRMLQIDKFAIAYKTYRYYPIRSFSNPASMPIRYRLSKFRTNMFRRMRYLLYLKWRNKFRDRGRN